MQLRTPRQRDFHCDVIQCHSDVIWLYCDVIHFLQLYLQQLYDPSEIPCVDDCNLFVFGIKSRPAGVVLGTNILTGYDVIHDWENKRIGFAPTSCQHRDNREGSSSPALIGPEMRSAYIVY